MKPILPLLVLPILALTSACTTQGAHGNDHWSQRSISNSLGRAALGYDATRDGDYIDFQHAQKKGFGTTIRRHFFHHNPENPFQGYDASYFRPRYPHSILPDTVTYIQEPVSSLIATFSEGGQDEFSAGLALTADGLRGKPSQHKSASYMRRSVGVVAE